jgi:WD40 repeat protein
VLRGHTDIVNETAFSPDGRWVVTASDHQRARVFRSELCGSVDELLELAKRRLGN